jgi:integrase
LSSLTWQSTASFAPATWSNFDWTTFAQEQKYGIEQKTGRPVQFEITEQSRTSVEASLPLLRTTGSRYLFPSRLHASPHISIRQYARLVHRWVESIGLESAFYGTHSMRRTKAAQIYRKTGNLRAVQLLLGHTKLESTVRYLGIEVDDALNIAEQIEL